MTPYQKGLLITGIGGLVLTVDIPMVRLGGGDLHSAQLTRSGLGVLTALVCWLFISWRNGKLVSIIPGVSGIVVAACYGISAVFFIAAVFNTTTANLVFILAFLSMFTAVLGWILLNERPANITLVTMVVMVLAVLLIVSDGIKAGNFFGDICAVFAALFIAFGIIIARKSGEDMGFAPMIGGVVPVAVALAVIAYRGGVPTFSLDAPLWTIANGAVVIPIAFWCLATGPKYLTGPEVGMFYLLETVLAPIWVWMIFGEVPTSRALVGGTILILALLVHTLWQMRAQKRQRLQAVNQQG